MCRFLLENGSDVDAVNNQGNTPFFMATESLQKDIGQVNTKFFIRSNYDDRKCVVFNDSF